jgi:hypothetical protein
MANDAPACKANISPAGRRKRIHFGRIWLGVSLALLVALVVLRAPWYCGLAMFVPVALSAVGFLQARRNTCVMRAKEGSFENDDFSTVKAPDDEVAASRHVAAGINRDVVLLGVGGVALAAVASVLFRGL